MFAYLKGEITYKSPTFITLEVHGVGYHVNIPLSTYSVILPLDKTTIYTHFHVREDTQTLYGFATQGERLLFVQLISVSGVGPNTAQIVLSTLSVDEIRSAVLGEQVHLLQKVKGIGAKTAKQIILDLKDKIVKEAPDMAILPSTAIGNAMREEALTGMVALGFNRIAVQKALNSVLKENPHPESTEVLIKATLRAMQ
jgi:Holliday junction DNA helicase RuvA